MKRRTLLSSLAIASVVPFVNVEAVNADTTSPLYPTPRRLNMGVAPTTAGGFDQMFQDKNDMDWASGDQATSFKHNGFTYWLFGDTILGTEDPDGSFADGAIMVANRIMLQQGDQLYNAIANGGSGPAVPNPATNNADNNERYWTQGMFTANGYIYVLCQRVKNNGSGFLPIGSELAKFTQNTTTGLLTLVGMVVTPGTGKEQSSSPYGIQWTADAVCSGGYAYFYGFALAQNNGYVSHFSYVARVSMTQVENPFAWRFYKKTTGSWVFKISELNQDNTNHPDAIVASQIGSVRYINNKFVMVHKPWNGWGSDVKVTTSTTPYGPFVDETTIFSSPAGSNYITYCPQLHPEQILTSGKTLVSIAWNGKTLTDTMLDADLYKPRFYEIQF